MSSRMITIKRHKENYHINHPGNIPWALLLKHTEKKRTDCKKMRIKQVTSLTF